MRRNGSRATRVGAREALSVAALAGVLVASGCGLLGDDAFEVGDCVKARQGITNDDLSRSDSCSESAITENIAESLYRVQAVLDGSDATCPDLGTFVVEFSHEPHGKTYCLVDPSSYTTGSTGAPTGGGAGDDEDYTGDGAPPECTEPIMEGREPPESCDEFGY
jgi:hypothetical protein